MKVVLFCGGLGTRLRDYSESVPKPMVLIGGRPILWHLMKYYAHFGHREFILCLGYMGDVIKGYFPAADARPSHDEDWTITFADTGVHSTVGQRLKAVQRYLRDEKVFLANYADGLSDLCLPDYLDHFRRHGRIASLLCVRPSQSFHVVSASEAGLVDDIRPAGKSGVWISGGFFVFRREIFEYLGEGEDLVDQPFQRLVACGQLVAYHYQGFWQSMDTQRDRQVLEDLHASGRPPWEVWTPRFDGAALSAPDASGPSSQAGPQFGV